MACPPANRKPPLRAERGFSAGYGGPGVGPPGTATLGEWAYRRLKLQRSEEAAYWPRTRPNFDIRSHNSGHNGRRDSIRSVQPWGKRGAPATGWHHGQRRAVIRRRDGGWLRGVGDRHHPAGAAVGQTTIAPQRPVGDERDERDEILSQRSWPGVLSQACARRPAGYRRVLSQKIEKQPHAK